MDLFDYMRNNTMQTEAPLASRMRPSRLEEIVGQQHILGKDKLLYRAIQADKLGSVIFYGPPGTGKTTIAKVIANTTSAEFTQINATVAGKKDMRCGFSGRYCRRGRTKCAECSGAWNPYDRTQWGWQNPYYSGGGFGMYSEKDGSI